MKTLLLAAAATLCFASVEPAVSLNSLKAVEASMNDRVRSSINDPYHLLGPARGTYIEGYGAVFTMELNLVVVSPLSISPFKPAPSEKDLADLYDHKLHKVDSLKSMMRDLTAGASKLLPGLPSDERIVMEAFLFNYSWEQTRGLPHRLVLAANKQKLLDAATRHATASEMAALFQEEEL